jgi:aminopeptidase N
MTKRFFLFLACILNISTWTFAQVECGELPVHCSFHKYGHHNLYFEKENNTGQNYDLVYHRFEWRVDPAEKYINGTVTSYFFVKNPQAESISFDLTMSLHVDSVIYHEESLDFRHQSEQLVIYPPHDKVFSGYDSISVYYQGIPDIENTDAFVIDQHDGTPVLWTLSEPYGAKEWWPCKQDLNDKIDSVDIIVTCPSQYRVASNGLLQYEITEGQWNKTFWKHRYPIAAYLVAIAVTNYEEYSDYAQLTSGEQLQILNYVYPEDLEESREKTQNIIPVMELFNHLFIDYPFSREKYGHAQFSWGTGAMEHQTMSFMSGFGRSLMAHELAHQWFGDYITCGSWQDIWLNEGFAVYCEGIVRENLSSQESWDNWREYLIEYVTQKDDGSVFVYDTTSVERIFNYRLTYLKAGFVLHMLRQAIGSEHFFQSIKNYLQDTALINGYARTKDLQKHFEMVSGTDLDEFFNDWVYGEGFPYFTIKWAQEEDETLDIIAYQRSSHSSVSFFEVKIPLLLHGKNQDSLIQFRHTYSGQPFQTKISFDVDSITFDPEFSILTKDVILKKESTLRNQDNVYIYPNPVRNMLTCRLESLFVIHEIEIISSGGRIAHKYPGIKKQQLFEITVKNIEAGLYYLRLKTDKGYIWKKFIKN